MKVLDIFTWMILQKITDYASCYMFNILQCQQAAVALVVTWYYAETLTASSKPAFLREMRTVTQNQGVMFLRMPYFYNTVFYMVVSVFACL